MFLDDENVSIAVDYVDISNLLGILHLKVLGYSSPMNMIVTGGGLEISLDQESWGQEVQFDFSQAIQTDLYVREDTSNYGTVSVLEPE